jgi:hypothetical protein
VRQNLCVSTPWVLTLPISTVVADIVVSTEMLLSPQQVERYRKLEKKQLEVWQVVVRQLRVWSASSSGADEG